MCIERVTKEKQPDLKSPHLAGQGRKQALAVRQEEGNKETPQVSRMIERVAEGRALHHVSQIERLLRS